MSESKQKLCFVLMPFKDDLKEVYWKAIKPACEEAGYKSLRVDELVGTFNINKKIIENIFKSDAVVADLTGWNPNVFYEMGVAHAIDNKTIMIIQKDKKLPFDVHTYRCIQYEQTELGLGNLRDNITVFLNSIDEWRKEPSNPVQDFKPFEALIPRTDLEEAKRQLKEKERQLRNSIPRADAEALQKQLANLKTELKKRPSIKDQKVLKKEVDSLRTQLTEKEHQIKILAHEADKKKEDILITPPPGMVLIPAGEFMMGTTDEQFKYIEKLLKEHKDWKREWFEPERPAHQVYLDAFFMDQYLVTNAQYAEFLNDWGKETDKDGQKMIYEHEWGVHKIKDHWEPQKGFEKHPVINVTWYGAQQYAKWAKKGLPAEAQWEQAARGGKDFDYATKDGTINHDLANYDGKIGKTTPVGKYPPNPYGLYDMSGNVWEWCQDWFDKKYYGKCFEETQKTEKPIHNPVGPDKGDFRALRGGSWLNLVLVLRSAYRYWVNPRYRRNDVGFRCSRAYR